MTDLLLLNLVDLNPGGFTAVVDLDLLPAGAQIHTLQVNIVPCLLIPLSWWRRASPAAGPRGTPPRGRMVVLPGAADLAPAKEDDRSVVMVAGIDGWLRRRGAEPEASERRRQRFGSFEGDRAGNIGALREELRGILGIVPPEQAEAPRITADVDALTGKGAALGVVDGGCTATAVRWPAFTVGGAG
eukprot:SAG11_NODE_6277_length_1345_cov_2.290530_1_plen_186_part_10